MHTVLSWLIARLPDKKSAHVASAGMASNDSSHQRFRGFFLLASSANVTSTLFDVTALLLEKALAFRDVPFGLGEVLFNHPAFRFVHRFLPLEDVAMQDLSF